MTSLDEDLALAMSIADAADRVTMAHFRSSDLKVDTKPDRTPVTEADQAAERIIRDLLADHRPDDGILGEEFGTETVEGGRRWIIDPIDGTANYLRAVPVWCTLIALETDGDLVVGVASAPALGRRWWAARGSGAFTRDVNGETRRLAVSGVGELRDASFSYSDERGGPNGSRCRTTSSSRGCWRTRAYGDFLSHVLVAEGAVDIAAEPALAPWDMAALVPIITESGGTMTAFDGTAPLAGLSAVTTNGQYELVPEVRSRPGDQ
ncbi:MAG: inositol monophosphatase family protein [Candidatus Nanopelagicales bacterium]